MARKTGTRNRIIEVAKQHSTWEQPFTLWHFNTVMEKDEGFSPAAVSPLLSQLVKTEKHFHRVETANPNYQPGIKGSKKSVYGYVWDSKKRNKLCVAADLPRQPGNGAGAALHNGCTFDLRRFADSVAYVNEQIRAHNLTVSVSEEGTLSVIVK